MLTPEKFQLISSIDWTLMPCHPTNLRHKDGTPLTNAEQTLGATITADDLDAALTRERALADQAQARIRTCDEFRALFPLFEQYDAATIGELIDTLPEPQRSRFIAVSDLFFEGTDA